MTQEELNYFKYQLLDGSGYYIEGEQHLDDKIVLEFRSVKGTRPIKIIVENSDDRQD